MLAARDTTASLMTSLLYEFCRNPKYWERCQLEVLTILGSQGVLVHDDVKRLKHLRYAINETLR